VIGIFLIKRRKMMKIKNKMSNALTIFSTLFLFSCATVPVTSFAEPGTDIRVLVMGQDDDKTSVKRSSLIFEEVLRKLKDQMSFNNFRMVDEEMASGGLDWKIVNRRSKTELLDSAFQLNNTDNAKTHSRALVLFKIYASSLDKRAYSKVKTKIIGEVYDLHTNEYKASFKVKKSYTAPADCNSICITEVVSDKAADLAEDLGKVLADKLSYLTAGTSNVVKHTNINNDKNYTYSTNGLMSTYSINFKHFKNREITEILDTMSEEFPGFSSLNLIGKGSVKRVYEYVTTAKAYKLELWLATLLEDMGFNVDREVLIEVANGKISITKVNPYMEEKGKKNTGARFR
jgi:hypothetical protein